MVRPHASESSKHLAVLFATTVTTEVRGVAPASASVGRSGEYSVFEALSICFPHASRDTSRTGISLVELNKSLEKERFTRVRFRNPRNPRRRKGADSKSTTRKWRDPENQSFYRYGNRRWRDPEDEEDMQYLRQAWPLVNQMSAATCPLSELCHVLRRAINADRESEAVQRKLVGLPEPAKLVNSSTPLSTAASEAATPVRGTPIPMKIEDDQEDCPTDSELSDSDDDWVQTVVLQPVAASRPPLNMSALAPSPVPMAPPAWQAPTSVPSHPARSTVKAEMSTTACERGFAILGGQGTAAVAEAQAMPFILQKDSSYEEMQAMPFILQKEASSVLKEEGLMTLLGCCAASHGSVGTSW